MMKQLSFTNLTPPALEIPFYHWDNNSLLRNEFTTIHEKNNEDKFIYIWGPSDCGKTHLLQSVAKEFYQGLTNIFIPLSISDTLSPQYLDNLEQQHLVILDDIQTICQNSAWEHEIFHLFNRIRAQTQCTLLISGNVPPIQLNLKLADLKSRLQWGLCYQIKEPCDRLKLKILTERAEQQGFKLPIMVAEYLLSHYERKLSSLIKILEYIDLASLQEQRQTISIPFVKKCIQNLHSI